MKHNLNREVGTESRRTYNDKVNNGFFDKYMSGNGLEIGGTGYIEGVVPILPTAINIEKDYPGYDGTTLPFSSETQDYVYSSHCLEHIDNYKGSIREWFRVLKVGGHLIISVPHKDLYEKKNSPPSRFNEDHKRFYSSASLLKEIQDSLGINSVRIRHLVENDARHKYNSLDHEHSTGAYEIEVVLEKVSKTADKFSW